jgi:hypothetical protein
VEELLAVSVRQNRRRSGGVGVRVRRTKERRGGGFDRHVELWRRGGRWPTTVGHGGGERRSGEQGTAHCGPVWGRGRWHVGWCGGSWSSRFGLA